MASADLKVDTSRIRSHSTEISSSASTIDESVSVADTTKGQVTGGAFGFLCSFFEAPVNKQIDNLREMISDLAGAEHRLVTCLQQWAYEMDQTESTNKSGLSAIDPEGNTPGPGGYGSGGSDSGG